MIHLPRSLRFRLALTYVLVFAALLSALGLAAGLFLQRGMRRYFDQQLIGRARQMIAALVQSPDPDDAAQLERALIQEARSVYYRDYFVELRDAHQRVIARSDNLGSRELPFDPAPLAGRPNAESLRTVSADRADPLMTDGQPLRLVLVRHESPGIGPLYLQVATSLAHVTRTTAILRRVFAWGMLLCVLAAAATAWIVSGRATRRLRHLSRAVRRLTPASLDQRRLPEVGRRDEIDRLIVIIDRTLERLALGFKAQQRFAQDVSHELKTPLSVLHTQAQVCLMDEAVSPDAAELARSVADESRRLSQLVHSLQLLARTSGRQHDLPREPVDLGELAADVVRQLRPWAGLRRRRIQLDVESARPGGNAPRARGDAELLMAMVSNLIRNAVRFSPEDQPVEVRVSRADGVAQISVRDHGPGLPPDLAHDIFDRFVQAPDHRDGGAGLGLAIARSIAELHQGEIAVADAPGGGCRFIVALPLAHPAD